MYNLTIQEIVDVTGGVLLCGDKDTVIQDICINSKEIKPGDLFVPIIGEKVDAHRFIESALQTGAATLTSEHTGVVVSEKPFIYVSDTLTALQEISIYIRDHFQKPVIGVTGSVGKTTTRQMIATVLSGCLNTYQTYGNQNSQIGVSLTLSHIDMDADVAVLEMGISEFGQMDRLSSMVKPDICVVTMIGVAHIEYMKTQENIRREKLSITNHMQKNGVLFLNGDDPLLAEVKSETGVKTFTYGVSPECDYRAENLHMENYQYVYDFVHGDTRVHVVLNALGKHNVGNSLVGLAIADYMGLDLIKAAEGLKDFKGLRQKLIQVPGKYTIIDDTYNASPDSMKASLNVLEELETEGKKIAVLGDMFELGNDEEAYHYELGQFVATKQIDELVVVGELSQQILKAVKDSGAPIKCYSFKDNGEVALYLLSVMHSEDIALIKGSNGMHMDEIVSNLLG